MRTFTAGEVTLPGDHLVRCSARGGRVRGLALRAEETVRTLISIHGLSPIVAQVAGDLAMGAQLLAADLKNPGDSLSLLLRCSGPLEGMVCVCDSQRRVRLVPRKPQVAEGQHEDGSLHVAEALGEEGSLTVIRDLGLREPYVGTIPLKGGKIVDSIIHYLWQSEQVASVCSLGLSLNREGVQTAGALLIQLLPDATEEDETFIEARAKGGFPELTFLLGEGFSPAQILDLFLGDPQMEYLGAELLSYHCPCNRERMEKSLLALGAKELEDLAASTEETELVCHFCNTSHRFSPQDIQALLDQAREGRPSEG